MASRLGTAIDSITSPIQSTCIKRRNLVDGAVVVIKVANFAKKKSKKGLIFNVDFEKTYDQWFLGYMLQWFWFGDQWRAWIRASVFFDNLSVLVN